MTPQRISRRVTDALCPVTALSFFASRATGKLHVIAGEANRLLVFDAEDDRLVCRVVAFASQTVHGICCADHSADLVVWGGRSLVRLRRPDLEGWLLPGSGGRRVDRDVTSEEVHAPDWIHDVALSPPSGGRRAAVAAAAHNEALLIRLPPDGPLRLGPPASPGRLMLYCARVEYLSPTEILVAAGTVFGQVHVWRCTAVDPDTEGDEEIAACRMLDVLEGHEGSVFGIGFASLRLPDSTGTVRLLASCSDDRTVIVWDVTSVCRAGPGESDPDAWGRRFLDARETGFGPGPAADLAESRKGGSRRLCSVMGHASRIWSVGLVPVPGCYCLLYSFGEDAAVQTWRLDVGRDDEGVCRAGARRLESQTPHGGKHIWASARRVREDGVCLVATGGGDGRVVVWGTAFHGPPPQHDLVTQDFRGAKSEVRIGNKEKLRRFAFVDDDAILVVTSTGRVFRGLFCREGSGDAAAAAATGEAVRWTECRPAGGAGSDETRTALSLCSAVRRVGAGLVVIGTSGGRLYRVRGGCGGRGSREGHAAAEPTIGFLAEVGGSVRDVLCLSGPAREEGDVSFLVAVAATAPPVLVTVNDDEVTRDVVTCLNEKFRVTSAALVGPYLLVGSRHGFLAVLGHRMETGTWFPEAEERRSRDTITAIVGMKCSAPPAAAAASAVRFLTTSRDGHYRIYEVRATGSEAPGTPAGVGLQLLHEAAPSLGPHLEGAWVRDAVADGPPEVVVYGFRGTDIVVHSPSTDTDLARVDCGGPHRTFALTDPPCCSTGPPRIAFAKASVLHLHRQLAPPQRVLRPGNGGRELRTVDCIGFRAGGDVAGAYVATGGEDTVVRIWETRSGGADPGRLRCLAVVRKHSAALQRVRWFRSGADLYLLTSAAHEELYVWRVRSARAPSGDVEIGIVLEAAYPDVVDDGELRITDVDVSCAGTGSGTMNVALAFSNSVFKVHRYSCRGSSSPFEPPAHGKYTGACLTRIRDLGIRGDTAELLTASTDGHLVLWARRTDEAVFRPARAVSVHRSSIKSLGLLPLGPDGARRLVITGGDDNALAATVLSMPRERPDALETRTRIVRGAHAASVNGVVVAAGDGPEGWPVRVVTASNDQRVRTWTMGCEAGAATEWRLVGDDESGVPDPGDLAGLPWGGVVVAGVGIEVWMHKETDHEVGEEVAV